MRKQIRLLLLLALPMLLGLAACSDKDIASFNNPLGSDIYGLWYADYQASGTIGGDNTPYSRVVQAVKFNSDGTGTWWKMMFAADDASKPLALLGGRYPEDGTFDYTVAADGTITAKRRGEKQLDGSPMTLTFHFADGVLTTQDGGATQTLAVAPKDYDNVLLALENSMGGAAADTYNINDKDFKVDQWRQQEAIYIYDGVSKGVKDENGNEGYASVNLPWYNGTVISNLPMDFCADITPENGWEWVLNYCGRRSTPNGNFFALYNKYLGILRFFYYLPQGYAAGNDHLWQVTMTQGLSDRYDLRYGIPMDKTVNAKNAYGLTADGTSWADDTTPYVGVMSNDGCIMPNPGWWAFDVDLSTYRSETIDPNAEKIRLQMRSWSDSHVSLFSTFTAESKGDFIDLTKASAKKSKGLFGKIKDVIKVGTGLAKTITSLRSGDVKGGISNGIAFGKEAISLKSTFSGGGGDDSGPAPTGTISFTTQGTANIDGVISTSQPTVGIVTPTFPLATDFSSTSTVGQGVWNLKTAPKIYTTNSACTYFMFIPKKDQYSKTYYWLVDAAHWSFFDPSSVEVVLNPNVFPEDQIEWMQVDAVAGLRKSLTTQEVDSFRTTMGMEPLATKNFADDQVRWTKSYGSEVDDYVFNFLAAEGSPEQTLEKLTYPKPILNGQTGYSIETLMSYYDNFGAWNDQNETINQALITFGPATEDEYIIEPQMVFWRDGLGYNFYEPGGGISYVFRRIARLNRADTRNGKSGYDYDYIMEQNKFDPNSDDNGSSGYVVGYDDDGKNGYPTTSTPIIDIKHIPVRFPAAEVNVTLTIKMKNMAAPIVYNRIYLPEYEYVRVVGDEQASLAILDRILGKKNLSPKTAGHTQSYDFQAARINKCFKLLTGYSR
jgi:hypothetical protein